MREMDIKQVSRRPSNLERMRFIQTTSSKKPRSEIEKVLLMRSIRNRFLKSLEEGKIQIKSEREWVLF